MNIYEFVQIARGAHGAETHLQTAVRTGPAMCRDWVRFAIVSAAAELADRRGRYWLDGQPVQRIVTHIYRNGEPWGRIDSGRHEIDGFRVFVMHTVVPLNPYLGVCTITTKEPRYERA